MAYVTVATPGAQGWTPAPDMHGIMRAAKLEMEPLNLDGKVGGGVIISLRCRSGGGAPPGPSLSADAAMAPWVGAALPRSILPPGSLVVNSSAVMCRGGPGQPPAAPAAPAGFAPEAWNMPRVVCRFDKGAVSPPSGSSTRSSSGGGRSNGSVEDRLMESEVALTRAPPGLFFEGAVLGLPPTVAPPSVGGKRTGCTTAAPASDALNACQKGLPGLKALSLNDDLADGNSEGEEDVDCQKKKKKSRYCKKSRDQYRRLVDRIIADFQGKDPADFVLDMSRLPKAIASNEEACKALMATVIKFAHVRDASAKRGAC